LVSALRALVEEQTAGHPSTGRRWVRHSVAYLTDRLRHQGFSVSRETVRHLLHDLGYSPKANRKRFTGPPHPDRERQFEYIARQRQRFAILGYPVISVDGKKKELIGNFQNPGRLWCEQATEVNAHDFRQDAVGRAAPYGIYDVQRDCGFVGVGLSAETAAFAVAVICRWWRDAGQRAYPEADELLVLCDAGGSNSCRTRLWKQQVQQKLADGLGLWVTVCHYPRGASKWNPCDHRLFSRISINWAGQPLRTLETLLACIRGTTTESGQAVQASVLPGTYAYGVKVPDDEVATWRLHRHETCPNWNYTIKPRWTIF
jgi:Rhodopirellula transposase DDE domain